ncbi:hypothetical protein ACSBR1_020998 [Camellia fascicularis]
MGDQRRAIWRSRRGHSFSWQSEGKERGSFSKLQSQLAELMGDKYNLFMVEEPNSEGPDLRSFGMLRKEVSEPGPTTLWQYVIPLLLFVPTIGSSVELGIASQVLLIAFTIRHCCIKSSYALLFI